MTEYFAPRRAEGGEPLALGMQSLFLSGRILPCGAKLEVTHVFRSSEPSPLEVIYCFPLPRDAALVSFKIQGPGFSVSSSLEPRAVAEKRYEQALEAGSTAAYTLQNRDGLVNLTVGNLRPGEIVSVSLHLVAGLSLNDHGFRLRFPFTVAPCYHPQMRASVTAPGVGLLELPEHVTAGAFLPPLHKDADSLHQIGFHLSIEPAAGIREIASPSHAIRIALADGQSVAVKLSPARDIPNRDLVLDVDRDFGAGHAWSDLPSDGRKTFSLIVPSRVFGQPSQKSRRVVFLLDRSGSMQGAPIKQAHAAIESCLAVLAPQDQFSIVAFDDTAECFHPRLQPASPGNVEEAIAFLGKIEARGGTELALAMEAAATLLEGRGEVFVMTDGQVSETVEILRRARKSEARLFCLGIGAASQDRFLELLARQTGGVCRFVTPAENIGVAARELFAALGGALASGVQVAKAQLEPLPAGPVFQGTPLFAFGQMDTELHQAEIIWTGGSTLLPIQPLANELSGLLQKLQGARLIADLEAEGSTDPAARQRLLQLSKRFGLASSEMSLVAVVERADDQGGHLPKTTIVPLGMPPHVDFNAYFHESFGPMIPPAPMLTINCHMSPAPITRGGLGAGPRPLLSVLREILARLRDHSALRTGKNANSLVNNWLTKLVSEQTTLDNDGQQRALTTLIDFLSSDLIDFLESGHFPAARWNEVHQHLETEWPELRAVKINTPAPHSA